jgi:WD40 repeat protein
VSTSTRSHALCTTLFRLGVSDSWGEGWLGTGASNGTVGITRTRLHPPADDALHTNAMDGRDRINYNLRGHTSPITFVVWNRQPLKLASCDENGMIYVWVPYEDRWSVELVNERSVKVRHFCWSPSGKRTRISGTAQLTCPIHRTRSSNQLRGQLCTHWIGNGQSHLVAYV